MRQSNSEITHYIQLFYHCYNTVIMFLNPICYFWIRSMLRAPNINYYNYPLFLFPKNMLPEGQEHWKWWLILTRTLTVTRAVPLLCLRGSGTASLSKSDTLTSILYCDSVSLSSESNSFITPDTEMKREWLSQDC